MFSTHAKRNFNFSVALNLSASNDFNLDQSKILSSGKALNEFFFLEIAHQSRGTDVRDGADHSIYTDSRVCSHQRAL